ncbi:MAG: DUF1670 domain-containing protein [Thermoplasmata archaeon]
MSDINRLKTKTSEQGFISEMEDEFELPLAVSKAILKSVKDHFSSTLFEGESSTKDKIEFIAVAEHEPAGKSLDECKLISVRLTFKADSDLDVLRDEGIPSLRRVRLLRFTEEALEQGALLTVEDLSLLLNSSKRTIRRDIEFYKEKGITVPTRGYMKDIGRSLSHKTKTIEFYLKGYQPTDIANRLHHSLKSIERYIETFSRVAYLRNKGFTIQEIRYAVGISEKLVGEYLELIDEYANTPLVDDLIDDISSNFDTDDFKKRVIE